MAVSKTITGLRQVKEKAWEGPNGPMWFVEGSFDDGSTFSRGAKSLDNALNLHTLLEGLVGQEHSYVIEDTGRDYQGAKKWALKEWPGKPERPGYGGGGGGSSAPRKEYVPRHRDTAEGSREEQMRIYRSVALQQAVAFMDGKSPAGEGDVTHYAESFYNWLIADMGPPSKQPSAFEKYIGEIDKAIKAHDVGRLDQIQAMIIKSVDKMSVTLDEAGDLDDKLKDGKKSLASAANHSEWTARKQADATKREPLHPNPQQNSFLQQAEEVF